MYLITWSVLWSNLCAATPAMLAHGMYAAATFPGIHIQACKKQPWTNKNYLPAYAKIVCKTANVMDNSKCYTWMHINCHIGYLANAILIFFIYALYQPYNPFTESLTLHVQKSFLKNPQILQQVSLLFASFEINWSLDSRCPLLAKQQKYP